MQKPVLPGWTEEGDDDVDPRHQWVHHPVYPSIANSAHFHPGAAVLILAEIVVLSREHDTYSALLILAGVVVHIYAKRCLVTEINAHPAKITQAVLVHIVQGVIVERDILELVAERVSFK